MPAICVRACAAAPAAVVAELASEDRPAAIPRISPPAADDSAASAPMARPAPAPLAMLRGRHRQRLLVHAARSLDVQDVIRDWLARVEWGAKMRVAVDVDPYSFL